MDFFVTQLSWNAHTMFLELKKH